MDYFALEGKWWLPHDPSHEVSGTLTFDADGVNLVVYDSLRRFEAPEVRVVHSRVESVTEPVVLGRARDGRAVTLFDVSGLSMAGPFRDVTEDYRVRLALVGIHTATDLIRQAWCEFDYLEPWVNPDSIFEYDGDDHLRLRWNTPEELSNTVLENQTIRVMVGSSGTAGESGVHFDRWTAFAVDPSKPLATQDLLSESIRPLQDLLVFAIGRPVRITSLRLVPADTADGDGSGEAFFNAIQPRPSPSRQPSWGDLIMYSAPTILTPKDSSLDIAELLRRWFELRDRHPRTLSLLLTPFYAPFMYTEHAFASMYQSAEKLRSRLSGREQATKDHRARVEAIISAAIAAGIDEEHTQWARRILIGRNDKAMHDIITEVVESAGPVGAAVLNAAPEFGKTVTDARVGVAHPTTRRLDAVGLYWHGQALWWVVRTRLLMELLGDDAAIRVAKREPFRETVRRIATQEHGSPEEALEGAAERTFTT